VPRWAGCLAAWVPGAGPEVIPVFPEILQDMLSAAEYNSERE
jgi:hypothetical protein